MWFDTGLSSFLSGHYTAESLEASRELGGAFEALVAMEVKAASGARYGDTAALRAFMTEYSETRLGVVVHAGDEVRMLTDRIVSLPWTGLAR